MHAPAATHDVSLRALVRLAAPVVLSRLGMMAMGLVDTIVVGRHSAADLGYLALAWAPTAVVLTTGIGLLAGVQVLTSRAIGAGRAGDTGAVLRRGLVYSFWLGLASFAVLAGAGGLLMHHVGLAPALADGAAPVLRVFALSLLPILVADSGIFWLEAHGRAVPGMIAMWAANVVNLGLNLWLVPGHSGFAVEGAAASAWATALSRTSLLVFVAVFVVAWRDARRFGIFAPPPRDPGAGRAMRRIGYASSVSYFVETSAFAGMTIFAGWIGAVGVASWAIVLNVASIIFMMPMGLSVATAVLVGRAFGAGDLRQVRRAGVLGFGATVALTGAVCLVVGAGAPLIAAAYTHDPAVQAVTAAALLLSCLFYVTDGLQVVAAQALRARGDIWLPTLTHSFSYVAVMVPLAYWLALPAGLGIGGIVWATIAASLSAAGLLLGRFFSLARG